MRKRPFSLGAFSARSFLWALAFAILYIMTPQELKNTVFHTAIVGGGAAGLFCAGSFSNGPKIVLEHNSNWAVKVSVSGGGKCNFSNRTVLASDYLSQNKHFVKSALAAFKPGDFLALLDEARLPWEERENGQLFARNAQDIVKFLLRRAQKTNAELCSHVEVLDILPEKNGFTLSTSLGTLHARQVVLATGGLSYPALGASGFGLKMARKWGLNTVEPRPALAGLTLPKEWRENLKHLAGNSVAVSLSCGGKTFTGPLLFTHEGISGPAVLQASLYWTPNTPVTVNFMPGTNVLEAFRALKNSTKTFSHALADKLSPKVAKHLLGPLERDLANASRAELLAASARLNQFTFVPTSTAGYTRAEVTAGGIDTREINPVTFETRKIPGLYVIGELLDVAGRVGGFNLHWAWSSAFGAARALEKIF